MSMLMNCVRDTQNEYCCIVKKKTDRERGKEGGDGEGERKKEVESVPQAASSANLSSSLGLTHHPPLSALVLSRLLRSALRHPLHCTP